MKIFRQPSEQRVRGLLDLVKLNASDITPRRLEHFFGMESDDGLAGVVGLEIYGPTALLRSLAVIPSLRGNGLGSNLLAYGESYARSRHVTSLYLLTETAEGYFLRHGYQPAGREDAPIAIKGTRQFSELCPVNSIFMVKHL